MKKKFISLSPKQFIQGIIPYAVIALYVSISFAYLVNALIDKQIKNDSEALARSVETSVRASLEPPALTVNSLVDTISFANELQYNVAVAMLNGVAKQYPYVAAFYFSTAADCASDEGWQVTSDGWEAPAGWSQLDRPWFKGAVAAKGELYASDVYINARTNSYCVSFSRAIYSKAKGTFLGVAGCDIPLDGLTADLSKLEFSAKQALMEIVDANGMYLTNTDVKKIMTKNYFDETSLSKQYKASNYLDGTSKTFVEKDRYYCVRKIGVSPWFVVIEGPTSEFTGKSYAWMILINIVTIVLILAAIGYTTWALNKTREKERELGSKMLAETQNLVVAAKENAATSQDQSAAVKEIVATMEDNNALSENIATKIKDVSSVAGKTSGDVSEGVEHLEANVRQLHEIADANQHTIDGIKNLSEKIDNIWDIVTLINSVADQAKIIAFNAELEASSAGEAGKNFHIVATEIRRLADGIIDGTKEIKERINEIQQSSDSLILASESGTEKINEGCESAKNLEERFESIKNASEITAGSAGDITTIIQQQAAASEQILITLKQIAAGVENFTAATDNISSASQNLKVIANELNEQAAQQGTQE